jgi:hypothetical protein
VNKFRLRWRAGYWELEVPARCGYPRDVVHKHTFAQAIALMDEIIDRWPRPRAVARETTR